MVQTEFSRKMDASGRIVVPSQLREKLNLSVGDMCEFFLHEHEGRTFLCIECPKVENEIDRAMRILRENGYQV